MYMDNIFENNIIDYFKHDVLQISCHPVLTQYIDKAMEVSTKKKLLKKTGPVGVSAFPLVLES